MIARAKRPKLHEMTAQDARASYEKSAPILEIASAPMFALEDLRIPTRDGATIRGRLYQPVEPSWAEPAPALLARPLAAFVLPPVFVPGDDLVAPLDRAWNSASLSGEPKPVQASHPVFAL